jgi:hypothetical protein
MPAKSDRQDRDQNQKDQKILVFMNVHVDQNAYLELKKLLKNIRKS